MQRSREETDPGGGLKVAIDLGSPIAEFQIGSEGPGGMLLAKMHFSCSQIQCFPY